MTGSLGPTSPPGRRARAGVAAAIVAIAALVGIGVAACGVPIDDEPRPIAQTTIAPTDDAPTTIAGTDGAEVSVYFLHGDSLERQGYPVEGEPTLRAALDFVLDPPAEGLSDELRSSVPPDTGLNSVEVSDGVAVIDLTSEINDVSGEAQKEAFAQIVFTTLAFPEIASVRFLVDGKAIDAPTDDGNRSIVTADNYDEPLNPR